MLAHGGIIARYAVGIAHNRLDGNIYYSMRKGVVSLGSRVSIQGAVSHRSLGVFGVVPLTPLSFNLTNQASMVIENTYH